MAAKQKNATAVGPVGKGAESFIEMTAPYVARLELTGTADIIFHRWDIEAVAEKGRAAKGSKIKKTDDLESYVYRDDEGYICIPGLYVTSSIINAAKYRQDPRSARKSAMDLYKAGVVPLTALARLGPKKWDYEHRCRMTVQRAGITRCRPAFKAGWKTSFDIQVLLPEYIPPDVLQEVAVNAGRLVGLADSRPTYGRFAVTRFECLTEV